MEEINNSSIMEQKTPKKRGRKTINIDYDRLEHLASLNMGTMDICRNLGISWDTFDRNKKRKAEFADALQRGKAKGLQRATSRLMDKIDDGEFQAIQFYLKNADSDNWADRQEVNHQLNLSSVLQEAQGRIIEGERVKEVTNSEQFLERELTTNKKTNK
jgi:nucleotidyltransferase/DNA polymerase involved in DNA repair